MRRMRQKDLDRENARRQREIERSIPYYLRANGREINQKHAAYQDVMTWDEENEFYEDELTEAIPEAAL